jgi:alpha,alpha-trehalase
LYFLEKTLLHIHRQLPDRVPADVFKERTRKRRQAIQDYFWDEEKGFFFDYNHEKNSRTESWTLSGVFPLFFGIATEEQAASVARHIKEKFLRAGGLVTTTRTTGQQWDEPNGWAPLQYMALSGLMQYGYTDLADRIRKNWRNMNEKIYADTGKMIEKYNVTDLNRPGGGGEYPNQDGFGWTNGVYLALPYLCPPNSLREMSRSKRTQSILQFGLFCGILLFVNILANIFYTHFDLTEEKRFTLTKPTRRAVARAERSGLRSDTA